MIKIGITGGIGSGKSTVCTLFSILGIPVYNSDNRAQMLMTQNADVIDKLKITFGDDIYLANGTLNKVKLAKLVFDSIETRQIINTIVHPAVQNDFTLWSSEKNHENAAYVIQESAILFETGIWKRLDAIITVTCPLEERIERIKLRDNCSKTEAIKKIDSQLSDKEKIEQSTFVIESSVKNLLIKNVLEIHNKIKQNEN
jgi:dephospho-CoA kinase